MTLGIRLVEAPCQASMKGCSSVPTRLRCPEPHALLELAARLGRPAWVGFGMGSVSEVSPVGPAETPSDTSAFSHRTQLSELLSETESMVRVPVAAGRHGDDLDAVSGITRGLSIRRWGGAGLLHLWRPPLK